jgi:dihydrofolate synthase/folylpolyglutamate synthase
MPSSRSERLAALFERTHAGIKPGLDLIRELLEALGDPQARFLSVHVAGTNGKGSTCAILERTLRETGLKTGLYTSPHLVRVNERIQLQGRDIDDDTFYSLLDRIEAVEPSLSRPPTFFEILTAAAFLAFADAGVQIAVLETGMGGRLDATNVVTPLVSVITRIDFDHMEYLGDTLPKIAAEKAGILKPGRPAILAPQMPEAMEVLLSTAANLEAPVTLAEDSVSLSGRRVSLKGQTLNAETPLNRYGKLLLPLHGRFQLDSLATALAALEEIHTQLQTELEPEIFRAALADLHWPARCQVLSEDPPVLLDVAHNPAGARALTDTLRELFGKKARGRFIIAHMADKNADGFLKEIAPLTAELLCVPLTSSRALPAETLAERARALRLPARALRLAEAKTLAQSAPADADFTCIAGSVYLAGAWLESATDPGER